MEKKLFVVFALLISALFILGCTSGDNTPLTNNGGNDSNTDSDFLALPEDGAVLCSNGKYTVVEMYGNAELDKKSLIVLGNEIRAKGNAALEGISDLNCMDRIGFFYPDLGMSYEEYESEKFKITSIEHLSKLKNLRDVDISYTNVSDLSPLFSLTGVKWVSLTESKMNNLEQLKNIIGLENVTILDEGTKKYDLAALSDINTLQGIQVDEFPSVAELNKVLNVKSVWVDRMTSEQIAALANFPNLVEFSINESAAVYSSIGQVKQLKDLSVQGAENIDFARNLSLLENINLNFCESTIDLAPLAGKNSLKDLSLLYCNVKNVSSLGTLPSLKDLELELEENETIDLSKFPVLEKLEIKSEDSAVDAQCNLLKQQNSSIDISCPSDAVVPVDSDDSSEDDVSAGNVSELVLGSMNADQVKDYFNKFETKYNNLSIDFEEVVSGGSTAGAIKGNLKLSAANGLLKDKTTMNMGSAFGAENSSSSIVIVIKDLGNNNYQMQSGFSCMNNPQFGGLVCIDFTEMEADLEQVYTVKPNPEMYSFIGTRTVNGVITNCFKLLNSDETNTTSCYAVDTGMPVYVISDSSEGKMEIFYSSAKFDPIPDSEFEKPAGATSMDDLMGGLLGGTLGSGSVVSKGVPPTNGTTCPAGLLYSATENQCCPAGSYTINVSLEGDGLGYISGADIKCGNSCVPSGLSSEFCAQSEGVCTATVPNGTRVNLFAEAKSITKPLGGTILSEFSRWSSGCMSESTVCVIDGCNGDTADVIAVFDQR